MVASGATLGGIGIIRGPVTVAQGATLAPGDNNIGTLSISNTLSLAGNTVMEISKSAAGATNDMLSLSTPLTYGGTLTASNIGTNGLAMGDSFKLFSASSYAGAFSSNALPALATNLVWDISKLTNNGTILVAALPVVTNQPRSLSVSNGSPASFSVGASGSPPLSYQWRKNGANLAAATATIYTIASTSTNDTAAYTVVVTNAYGSATSQLASLSVTFGAPPPLPQITQVVLATGGSLVLTCTGQAGQAYVLRAGPALEAAGSWPAISTNTAATNGVFQFTDPTATNAARFYRLSTN